MLGLLVGAVLLKEIFVGDQDLFGEDGLDLGFKPLQLNEDELKLDLGAAKELEPNQDILNIDLGLDLFGAEEDNEI